MVRFPNFFFYTFLTAPTLHSVLICLLFHAQHSRYTNTQIPHTIIGKSTPHPSAWWIDRLYCLYHLSSTSKLISFFFLLIYLLFYFSFSNSLFFPFQRIPSHQVVWQLLFFFYFLFDRLPTLRKVLLPYYISVTVDHYTPTASDRHQVIVSWYLWIVLWIMTLFIHFRRIMMNRIRKEKCIYIPRWTNTTHWQICLPLALLATTHRLVIYELALTPYLNARLAGNHLFYLLSQILWRIYPTRMKYMKPKILVFSEGFLPTILNHGHDNSRAPLTVCSTLCQHTILFQDHPLTPWHMKLHLRVIMIKIVWTVMTLAVPVVALGKGKKKPSLLFLAKKPMTPNFLCVIEWG